MMHGILNWRYCSECKKPFDQGTNFNICPKCRFKNKVEKDMQQLTPVEDYKGILLKRDDKFKVGLANGGKLRQALTLIQKNIRQIKEVNNNHIICPCSIKSPQSGITATACRVYGLKCSIIVYKTEQPNSNLTIAQKEGASIYGCNTGYENVLSSYAKKYFPNSFITKMGFSTQKTIDVNVKQVKNIPEDLDYLVVPVGSALNFISILKGVNIYNKRPKKIIGVWVGKNPYPTIKKYYGDLDSNIRLVKYNIPYSTKINLEGFDPIYEAKAYDWLLKNIDYKNNKVLFWVVGKRGLDVNPEEINYKKLENGRE